MPQLNLDAFTTKSSSKKKELDNSKFNLDTSKFDTKEEYDDPVLEKPLTPEVKPDEEGWLSKAWHMASDPLTDAPSRFAESVSNYINPDRTTQGLRGIGSAYIESLGNAISGLSSPINLATLGTGMGETAALKYGLPEIARGMNIGTKALSVPMVAEGAKNIYSGEGIPEKLMGGLELAGGLAGLKAKLPEIADRTIKSLPENWRMKKSLDEPVSLTKKAAESRSTIQEKIRGTDADIPDNPVARKLESERRLISNKAEDTTFELAKAKKIINDVAGRGATDGLTDEFIINKAKELDPNQFDKPFDPSTLNFEPPAPFKAPEFKNTKRGMTDESRAKQQQSMKAAEKIANIENEVNLATGEELNSRQPTNIDEYKNSVVDLAKDQVKKNLSPSIFDENGSVTISGNRKDLSDIVNTPDTKSPGKVQQRYDLARGLMSADLPFVTSAAFRQANSHIGTKAWFQAWGKAAKAYGSKAAAEAMNTNLKERPLFKEKPILDNMSLPTGKFKPSYADEVGLRIGDLSKYSKRDEAIRGELAERTPIYGRHVAASNRAYNAFINHVAASNFESLINDATKLHELGKSGGITGNLFTHKVIPNPIQDLTFGRNIAEFVNTSLRRGKLGAELGSHEINLEKNARLLSNTFFSPRTISSQARMLNPSTYITAEPFLRRQYLGSMLRQVGTWWTIAELAKLGGAQVSKDPNSADFGKIKIGNTRIDVPGGLQQFLVLANRTLPEKLGGGGITSTNTGRFTPFGQGFKPETRATNALSFGINRLHPTAKFAWDLFNATNQKPFHVGDRMMQMVMPMFVDDLAQVAKEDPALAPMILGLSGAGVGTQSYERGSYGKPVFIPEKHDINIGAR